MGRLFWFGAREVWGIERQHERIGSCVSVSCHPALDGDGIRLKFNRSPEPVEVRFTARRTSTGSVLRCNNSV